MPAFFPELLIIGCGNMGSAMLRGWLAGGVSPERITVVDPVASQLPEGVHLHRSASDLNRTFDVILLGIKPQTLSPLAPEIAATLSPGALVISILAGAQTHTLATHFPAAQIVRLMPNLAAAIGKSPLGLFSNDMDADARRRLDAALAPLGTPIWIDDEGQMDAVTALAGSGPAFVYRVIDALAQGGIAAGLPENVAAKLALSMTEGAALLATGSPASPAELAKRVTSPGGTTAAGLSVLDNADALQNLISETLRAARDRGAALAKGE